ncbi:uncharacterized protein [Coffea arabica]|uniref:Reverse transcriptase domain-containing protein n=1 Tax=Coffea arabica TaxID=13443 RepID=A0ABM4V9I9_COFAR
MGFCPIFVRWIMSCMSSVTYSFNFNGERVGYVKPSRGIRQGDPLSPYLFLFCSEGLSNLMARAIENRQITGIKVSRNGPVLSHLFFADDSLFCCKAHPQEARAMQRILAKYELALGQCINYDKSAAFFSRNCSRQQRRDGSTTYSAMQEKRLPKGLCTEICGHMVKFWRGQNEEERKMQWISWEKITQVKGNGGWDEEAPRNASWVWKSIYSSGLVLQKGMWKRVGDGTTINIWRDKWIMESSTGKIATKKPPDCNLQTVADLLIEREWNKELIEKTFSEQEASQILQMPLSLFPRKDTIYWKYSKSGNYTVKSGYAVEKKEWDGLFQWRSNFWRWWEGILEARSRSRGEDHITLTANIIWQIWKARNARQFEGKYGEHMSILENAKNEWLEFQEEQMENEKKHRTGTSHQMQNHQWRPPDAGVVKINTDAATPTKSTGAGLGMIARDSYGNIVEARGIRKYSRGGAEIEEAAALRQGLLMAREAGWRRIEMQTDCKAAIETI